MSEQPLIDNHMPKYEFIDGHFYCDGVKVMPSQLTEEEIKKYIPVQFQATFFKSKNPVSTGVKSNDKK